MYESGVTCSGRTPRSSTLSILSPPPSPLIAHGVHARTPTTKSKPATVRRGTGHVPTTPFRASMCVCACATTSIPLFDFFFLGKIGSKIPILVPSRCYVFSIRRWKWKKWEKDNAREGGGGGLSRVVVFRDPDIVLRAMPRAIITCRPLRGIVTNPPYGVVAGRTRNGRRMRVENRCYVTNRN